MWYSLAADAVVLLHLSFVFFVVGGGFLCWRWRWLAWIHAPSAIWGVAIEFGGWICPLTPLENHLRRRAGEAAYAGDFVQHHVLPLLYPVNLTDSLQVALGVLVLLINGFAYAVYLRRRPPDPRQKPTSHTSKKQGHQVRSP
jgi:hypothetical protein